MTSEQVFTRNGLTLVVPQDVPGLVRDVFVRLCCMGVCHAANEEAQVAQEGPDGTVQVPQVRPGGGVHRRAEAVVR